MYGVRYERGQTANVLVDIPGVIARMDAPRLCCALGDTARSLQEGDGLNIAGRWYAVLACRRADGHPLRRGAERGRAGWD
ncbi:MAG: hypothetical protein ACLUHE_08390 [Christensenellales bacterium]